ncbi:hypothetical protein DFH07DRAFT_946978 [Mycena maculata]|uniref:Uncharacterized protein n=1 Tax=Mycena maculata TaxID=230809 RepID=A0AAD7HHI5_9AGAR|nr:hypothetical protein DFH07DRAFT_946978 [Mycena maculata]
MAHIIRTAKSGNDWTENDLAAYNIHAQSLVDFFGIEKLPSVPASLGAFITTKDRTNATDNDTYKLLHHLDLAHMPKVGQEAAVDLFAEKLGYADGRRAASVHLRLQLQRSDGRAASSNDILLLVQDGKRLENGADPEPQVIADAIAAFQRNNFTRERELHLPALDRMLIPTITCAGRSPLSTGFPSLLFSMMP